VHGGHGLRGGPRKRRVRSVSAHRRGSIAPLTLGLALVLCALIALSLRFGSTSAVSDLATSLRAALSMLGLASPLEPGDQQIVELRLWHALTASGVGAALGLSGALVQGVFRNGLASPSVLGISGGACLGAIFAILFVGGYGAGLRIDEASARSGIDWLRSGLVLVPLCAFVGALATALAVYRLASTAGRVSIPALLLVGIAVNTFLGGVQQLVQMLVLGNWEVSKSILLWSFGTLDDRQGWHAAVVWCGAAIAATAVPFVARELDLMQPGLEDAAALGVDVRRVKFVALAAASLAAAASVAVAGQIAFVGLIVPHIVRLISGPSHRTLLPLSALCGACFLLGADLAQRAFFPSLALQPGVLMSLVGGPFFVWLLWTKRREIAVW
jgi:iron complex transport system permease protein